ncbi:MAG: hypothetical protein RR372_05940 [Oscillospiraceae bacterium]
MNKKDKENPQKPYPILPYLIVLLAAVVSIVLLSYFAQTRHSSEEISKYSQEHGTQIEQIYGRLDELEARIQIIENKKH